MKATVISLIFCILLISNVSAIRINEVELNPVGGSAGKEWIELYNNDSGEIDISGWMVYDGLTNPSKIFTIPNNTLLQSNAYYIIELNYSKLNNPGDFVTLYGSSGNKIDETNTLNDSYADARAWQFCDGDWKFLNSTREQENNCIDDEEIILPENNDDSEENLSQDTEQTDEEENTSEKTEQINQDMASISSEEEKSQVLSSQDNSETIFLSPKKSTKETFITSEGKIRSYLPYFFMVLIIILCLYLAFKKF